MSNKTKKINIIIDLILLAIFLVCSTYFIIETIKGELIPISYIKIAVGVLFVIFVLFLLSFLKQHISIYIIRKILLVVLCAALVVGTVLQAQVRSAFENVDDASQNIRRMYVVVLNDSEFETIGDISSYCYYDTLVGTDEYANMLVAQTINELSSYEFEVITSSSMEEGINNVDNKISDAMLITDLQYEIYCQQDSQFEEKYGIIHEVKMAIEANQNIVVKDLTEPFVVYISGMDDIGMPNYNGRSDVNMLAFVDPVNNHVELVSINRDTYVLNKNVYDYPDKLTHLGWYGAEASATALERSFGIEIDYTVRVTFESLIKIIDSIGGIDVDVKISFTEQNEYRSFKSDDLIHLEKGYQHLNGSQALAYARHRKSANWGVAGREQAQRDIIEAVVKKLLSVEGALKVGDMLDVAASYVSTNLPISSAKSFLMNAIEKGQMWTFGSSTVDSGYEYLLPCAMISFDVYAVLLTKKDIQNVYNMYYNMMNPKTFNDFTFDVNDLTQEQVKVELENKIVTFENYYYTINRYFPSYLRTIY